MCVADVYCGMNNCVCVWHFMDLMVQACLSNPGCYTEQYDPHKIVEPIVNLWKSQTTISSFVVWAKTESNPKSKKQFVFFLADSIIACDNWISGHKNVKTALSFALCRRAFLWGVAYLYANLAPEKCHARLRWCTCPIIRTTFSLVHFHGIFCMEIELNFATFQRYVSQVL